MGLAWPCAALDPPPKTPPPKTQKKNPPKVVWIAAFPRSWPPDLQRLLHDCRQAPWAAAWRHDRISALVVFPPLTWARSWALLQLAAWPCSAPGLRCSPSCPTIGPTARHPVARWRWPCYSPGQAVQVC